MRCLICAVVVLSSLLSASKITALGLSQQRLQITSKDKPLFDSAFDAFVEATLLEWHVPGLSIAVVDNGKITSKGYGLSNLPDTRATADTQYFTGSTGKAFTAAAAALLVHDDKYLDVKWTSPLKDFIPADFALEDPHATTHTTIEDALSHRSGLPGHDLMYGQLDDTPSSVVQRMRYLPMTAQPRTTFQYCNIMYGVVTDLVETVTGQKLETVLRENFWKPLGMLSTTFTLPSVVDEKSRLARGYYWDPPASNELAYSKGRYVAEPYIDISPISGAGSTISTVNDYALWIKAWLDAAQAADAKNTSSPITKRIFHDLLSPRTIVSEPPNDDDEPDNLDFITPPNYALGWATSKVLDETIVGHNGGLTGFGTEVYMLPGHKYGVITMGNTAETSNDAGAIVASHLLLEKLNTTAADRVLRSQLRQNLIAMTGANPRRSKAKSPRRNSSSILPIPTSNTLAQCLPGSIADFAGQYSHPAYGTINLTVTAPQHSPSESILEGLFYPRTWPLKIQLYRITDTVFAVKSFTPHGLGDISSGKDTIWEDETDDEDRVVFERGLDGVVETMGVELDESMVDVAREKGARWWRDGMIWFEKGMSFPTHVIFIGLREIIALPAFRATDYQCDIDIPS